MKAFSFFAITNAYPNFAIFFYIDISKFLKTRSRWPRALRRRSAAACFLGLRVRLPPGNLYLSRECCVLLGRGLGVGPITRPEEFYRLCVCVCVCARVYVCVSLSVHLRWIGRRSRTKNKVSKELDDCLQCCHKNCFWDDDPFNSVN
jgi:hypothetical protein